MNVFDLDQALVNDYERFARSFTLIRASDIRQRVEELYALMIGSGRSRWSASIPVSKAAMPSIVS